MSLTEIPIRFLPQRATVMRVDTGTGDYSDQIYTDLPCRIGRRSESLNTDNSFRSSASQASVMFVNHENGGSPVDIRIEDRILVAGKKYRVLSVVNAAGAGHHLEIDLESFDTMQSAPS